MTVVGVFPHVDMAKTIDERLKTYRGSTKRWYMTQIFSEDVELISATWEGTDVILIFQYPGEEILHFVRSDIHNPLLKVLLQI